ncbi:MAG: aminotransferase class III-fold pyridoxal phosphate-dependent enzyme, partial [Proteobacteria bacterium]|nr:aminotransferase class III-fold pyridoxal phosphate-dependent enzyme [Pseudomonadota bacterium]
GSNVSESLAKANQNIIDVSQAAFIFNRSHSNVAWTAHVFSEESDTRNISTIMAQIKSKRDALLDAKHEYVKRKATAKALREDAELWDKDEDGNYIRPHNRQLLIDEAEKWDAYSIMMQEAVGGACKDIAHLTDAYKHFETKIRERNEGRFDEEIFEKEDILGNVRRNEGLFRELLEGLYDIPIVGDVRGAGYFFGIELVKNKATKESFNKTEAEEILFDFVSPRLSESGLICRTDDRGEPVIQLSPPLIAGPDELREIATILRNVLTEAAALVAKL